MQLLGHRGERLLAAWPALGALAALVPALWMWGFTVDDALIAIRYARHLNAGIGWRFNAHGPSTDGVTPLPWPALLTPFAWGDALAVLGRAKALGLVAWVVTGTALGRAVGRVPAPAWARAAALGTMALSVPVAAHAVSGMETALATTLATFAAIRMDRPRAAALLAGLAAALRPEMAPWALVLALGAVATAAPAPTPALALAPAPASTPAPAPAPAPALAPLTLSRLVRWVEAGAIALAPFAACSVIRALAWGRPVPLAVLAKPSDVAHGLAYAGAACVVTLVPVLLLAPWALVRQPRALAIVLAGVVQVGAIVLVGGDWMPYARLMVPVVPSLVYAAALASRDAGPLGTAATAARSLIAMGLGVVLLARGGSAGRQVGADRAALVARARPLLEATQRVAALDIGWVSAATEADVIDLAGLTDPEVAVLPGGHTSKRVDARFFLARAPDAWLLYAPRGLATGGLDAWQDTLASRGVEAHLSSDEVIGRHFAPSAWLPLGSNGSGYILLRSR